MQQMPMYYQLYEDYQANADKLDIKKAISSLTIPVLLCHGTMDTAVPVEKAFELKKWQPAAQLFTVESDHVFGRRHPWPENDLPPATEAVVGETISFLKRWVKALIATKANYQTWSRILFSPVEQFVKKIQTHDLIVFLSQA